jgi:hypothetical protein
LASFVGVRVAAFLHSGWANWTASGASPPREHKKNLNLLDAGAKSMGVLPTRKMMRALVQAVYAKLRSDKTVILPHSRPPACRLNPMGWPALTR